MKFAHNQNEKKDTEWKLDESNWIFKDKRFLDDCIVYKNLIVIAGILKINEIWWCVLFFNLDNAMKIINTQTSLQEQKLSKYSLFIR